MGWECYENKMTQYKRGSPNFIITTIWGGGVVEGGHEKKKITDKFY